MFILYFVLFIAPFYLISLKYFFFLQSFCNVNSENGGNLLIVIKPGGNSYDFCILTDIAIET